MWAAVLKGRPVAAAEAANCAQRALSRSLAVRGSLQHLISEVLHEAPNVPCHEAVVLA